MIDEMCIVTKRLIYISKLNYDKNISRVLHHIDKHTKRPFHKAFSPHNAPHKISLHTVHCTLYSVLSRKRWPFKTVPLQIVLVKYLIFKLGCLIFNFNKTLCIIKIHLFFLFSCDKIIFE